MRQTNREKEIIVVSGINLYTGGTLKVMQDCLAALSLFGGDRFRIIALVHQTQLYSAYRNVEFIEYPQSRKSWFYRLYYEYIGFWKLSKKWRPDYWLSLHDTTPRVWARKQFVYCHNPFPFYHSGWRGLRLQYSIYFFSLFSRWIYRINIRKNEYVIVQQQWIRDAFKRMFPIRNVVVSLPIPAESVCENRTEVSSESKTIFFYPAGAMIHKNFEILCQVAVLLQEEKNLEIILTLDGSENKYTRSLYEKYAGLHNLTFTGFLKRGDLSDYYDRCDCVVFPSKAETWGLPITEAKSYHKPIFVSNLPYARETVGKYDRVKFFDPDDAVQLAEWMKNFKNPAFRFDETEDIVYENPFARNWEELFGILFGN